MSITSNYTFRKESILPDGVHGSHPWILRQSFDLKTHGMVKRTLCNCPFPRATAEYVRVCTIARMHMHLGVIPTELRGQVLSSV